MLLQPFDSLSIKEAAAVERAGERDAHGRGALPGTLFDQARRDAEVGARARRRTDRVRFPEGSVFTREELQRARAGADRRAGRPHADTISPSSRCRRAAANQGQAARAALTVGQSLLAQLRGTKAVGRLVIDLPRAHRRASRARESDVILRDGDQLIVPKFQQEVTVIGEVQNATSHLYQPEPDAR